jgi:P27 family predicted phage terminase small subunit
VPRTKKAAGQAVDRRNGRRAGIAAAEPLRKFALPKRSDGRPWRLETRKAWTAVWRDPISLLWSVADRPVLLRYAGALHRAEVAYELADTEPMVDGSQGQLVRSPMLDVGDGQVKIAQACEAQLGVGALNRSKLGLEFASAQKSLAELNAGYGPDGGDDDDEPDPRAIPGTVER